MANDKDFLLKNAVEVGGPTKVTLGTVTNNDIDLATGNYFAETLSANTTYTISNAGDVQSFQLEVTGGSAGYAVTSAVYDSVSFSSDIDLNPHGLSFKTDGTKMYVQGEQADDVKQYTLSTAWDLSTASYDSVSFSVSSQTTAGEDVFLKTDGTKMYVIGGGVIYQYSMSTAWDLSTASYDSKSHNVSAQNATPKSLTFNANGTKAYIGESAIIFEYDLSTAWDISTASYNSVSFSGADQSYEGMMFNPDGTRLFITGEGNLLAFDFSTPYDLSTAVDNTDILSVSSTVQEPVALYVGNSGLKTYIADNDTDTIYQFTTTSTATITWPSSIEWAGGVAPSAPATGETDVFTLSTDDGGTAYVGVKTADNLS